MSGEIMQKQLSLQTARSRNNTQKQIEPHLVIRKSTARASQKPR